MTTAPMTELSIAELAQQVAAVLIADGCDHVTAVTATTDVGHVTAKFAGSEVRVQIVRGVNPDDRRTP